MFNFYNISNEIIIGLSVALGIGLLIGTERERHQQKSSDNALGVRTFTISSLIGAVSILLTGQETPPNHLYLLCVALLVMGGLTAISYIRTSKKDAGLTTESALVLTVLLGGFSIHEPLIAACIGIMTTGLLMIKSKLHAFIKGVLSEQELSDAFIFLAIICIFVPLAPNKAMGPYNAINPHTIVMIVVVIMSINGIGYVAQRIIGIRYGLAFAGFISGFISSTATVYTMGLKSKQEPQLFNSAVAGGIVSNLSTLILLAVVLSVIEPNVLKPFILPLIIASVVLCAYSAYYIRQIAPIATLTQLKRDRAFNVYQALSFAFLMTVVLFISAVVNARLGEKGMIMSALFTGLFDAHATAASIASLVTSQKLTVMHAILPIIIGLSSNTFTKIVVAFKSGGVAYAMRISAGLVLMIGCCFLALTPLAL
ncbi:MAG: MgtC/SapB family protein [Candidatus Saccharibacteria bacterium]|nr:MgtC/SapB family protein [Moraxellaceae bacterium]